MEVLPYKSKSIEQFHILQWLKKNEFDLENFDIELMSRHQVREKSYFERRMNNFK